MEQKLIGKKVKKKYHSYSDISQDNDACVHVIPVIVVFCGLAHFKLYLRVHLKCFVYLYVWGYPGAGSKKDMYKHIIQSLIFTRTQL